MLSFTIRNLVGCKSISLENNPIFSEEKFYSKFKFDLVLHFIKCLLEIDSWDFFVLF